MFRDDDLLPISALQHLAFCQRQWGLIHLERLWAESDRTVEGRHLHDKADDPFVLESRGDLVVSRSVPLASRELGLSGVADVIEFRRVAGSPAPDSPDSRPGGPPHTEWPAAVALPGRDGLWVPRPVEYKRGKPKPDDRDAVQLAAQAMCLEEMLRVRLEFGDLFYAQTRRRTEVPLDETLRGRVRTLSARMHEFFAARATPPTEYGRKCSLCSLKDLCLPRVGSGKGRTVRGYLDAALDEGGVA